MTGCSPDDSGSARAGFLSTPWRDGCQESYVAFLVRASSAFREGGRSDVKLDDVKLGWAFTPSEAPPYSRVTMGATSDAFVVVVVALMGSCDRESDGYLILVSIRVLF